MRHLLERKQFLPIPVDEAWRFFSDPRNLAAITPPELGFVIHGDTGEKTYAGQRITYTVKPLLGIPVKWITLIEDVQEPHAFVDTQLKGPYKYWHHRHTFKAVDGGTLMKDRVEYELPLGPLGDLMHRLVVKDKVRSIFDHRYKVLEKRFPVEGAKASLAR
jgi:ligand-binding SRPBCC domain-containing protein